MIAAMYLRKSRTEENAPIEETLARHKDALTDYAATSNITIAAIYEEVASGDSLAGRPQMLRLLDDLNKYEAVLCMDIDRLGRGTMRDQGIILDALKEANALVVTPSKTYNLRDDMDDSLISFKALFAREEYKLIRGRLHRGVMRTIQDGGYVANAPYGYIKTRIEKKPTLAINEQESAAVKMIFDLYIEGKGCQQIADTLHSMGYRPHRGDKFNRTSIAKILRNPVYIGKIAWNQIEHKRPKSPEDKHKQRHKPKSEWLIVDGLHPPIIDVERFEEANRIYTGRYHPPFRKPDEVKNSLAGVLYCANCGKTMVRMGQREPKVKEPFMLCPTKGCCMGCRQDVLEPMFYAMLQVLLSDMKPNAQKNASPIDYEPLISSAKSELAKLQKQLASLHDFLEQGVYDVDTFLTRRDEIQGRINETESVIGNMQHTPEIAVIIEKLETLIENYWDWEPIKRNAGIKDIIGRVEYSKPKGSGWKTPPSLRFISWAKNI